VGHHYDGLISADDRLAQLAAILAAGISRLHRAEARINGATSGTTCQLPPESPPISANLPLIPLERSRATGVTVDRAVNRGEAIDLSSEAADQTQEFSTWL
jgi:hypothetical protein